MHEYVSTFIDECILDSRFSIREYSDYTATVDDCSIQIFQDLRPGWTLRFDWNDHLEWFVDERGVEVMNGYVVWFADERGIEVMNGYVKFEIRPPCTRKMYLLEHEEAADFIQTIIGPCHQIDTNVFKSDGMVYDFNTMKCNKSSIQAVFMIA